MDKIKLDNPKIGMSLSDMIEIQYDIVDNDYTGDRVDIKNILTNANWSISEKGTFPVWTFGIIPPPLVESSYNVLTDWLAFVETMMELNHGKVLKFHPNKERHYVYDVHLDVTVVPMEFTFMLKVNIYGHTKLIHTPNDEYIRLVSPKVNDVYGYGDYIDIVYVSENLTIENTVTLSLYVNGLLHSMLGTITHSDGHVQIPMPLIEESNDVTIKAEVNGLSDCFSMSDKFSSSKPISIDIISPDSETEAIANTTVPIQWMLDGVREYIAIDLYVNSLYHSTIAKNILSSTNVYQWIVPENIESTNCYIKVIAYNGYNNYTGYGSFSISSKIFSVFPTIPPSDPPAGDPVPDSIAYFEFNGNMNDLKGNYACIDHGYVKTNLLTYTTEPTRQVLRVRNDWAGFRLNLPLHTDEWTIGIWMKRWYNLPNPGYSCIPWQWHQFSVTNGYKVEFGFNGGYNTTYNNESGRQRTYCIDGLYNKTELGWLRDDWQYYVLKKVKVGMTYEIRYELHWVGANPYSAYKTVSYNYNPVGTDAFFYLWSQGLDMSNIYNSFLYKFLRVHPRVITDYERDQIITWEVNR